jgi:hypothetical protein
MAGTVSGASPCQSPRCTPTTWAALCPLNTATTASALTHLVSLALLGGVLRPRLDVGLRLGYLLAHLRPCCVVVGLVYLEIQRFLALDQQPLAMDGLATLANAVVSLFLLDSA